MDFMAEASLLPLKVIADMWGLFFDVTRLIIVSPRALVNSMSCELVTSAMLAVWRRGSKRACQTLLLVSKLIMSDEARSARPQVAVLEQLLTDIRMNRLRQRRLILPPGCDKDRTQIAIARLPHQSHIPHIARERVDVCLDRLDEWHDLRTVHHIAELVERH
jgi:hypothetical protein